MYSIIFLAAIGGFGTALVTAYFAQSSRSKIFHDSIWGSLCGAIAGAVIAFIIGMTMPMRVVVSHPETLVAMRSSDGVAGTFLWGSGTIKNQVNYNFMLRMKDGSMAPHTVPADKAVRLIEDPELKNVGYWRTTTREPDTSSELYKWSIFSSDRTRIIRQEFRVPVGTVVQQFNIK